ncbi:MAG TPA: DUF5698 domain-containing protein [Tepidisphaeraceae bacterium]|nr:DUF5698 domain-containing protein [Tepidisphaeraceae bacterium]
MDVLWTSLLIFGLRACDVSIGTLRSIYANRGRRAVAASLGLFESLIFVFAISKVFSGLTSHWTMVAYACGFATGNFLGITIERWIGSGTVLVRIIVRGRSANMMTALRSAGFGATALQGAGGEGEVDFYFVVAPRRRQRELLELAERVDPDAFVTLDAVNHAGGGYVSATPPAASVKK